MRSRHRHIFVKSYDNNRTDGSGSVISRGALLSALREAFQGYEVNIPYISPVRNVHAYLDYVRKHSGQKLTSTDEAVITAIRENPRQSDSDLLANLITKIGLTKAHEYKNKMPLLRDFVKIQDEKSFPAATDPMEYVKAAYASILRAKSIRIPLDTTSFPGETPNQVALFNARLLFHHLALLNCVPRMRSTNGDAHYGIYLYGPSGCGKTTLLTGMHSHAPPPDRGVGKWNTNAPVLIFDDWTPDKLFGDYQEYVRRVALGHDLTVSVHSSARNIGCKWIVITSNEDMVGQPEAITRRFINVEMRPLNDLKVMAPNVERVRSAFLKMYHTVITSHRDEIEQMLRLRSVPFAEAFITYADEMFHEYSELPADRDATRTPDSEHDQAGSSSGGEHQPLHAWREGQEQDMENRSIQRQSSSTSTGEHVPAVQYISPWQPLTGREPNEGRKNERREPRRKRRRIIYSSSSSSSPDTSPGREAERLIRADAERRGFSVIRSVDECQYRGRSRRRSSQSTH